MNPTRTCYACESGEQSVLQNYSTQLPGICYTQEEKYVSQSFISCYSTDHDIDVVTHLQLGPYQTLQLYEVKVFFAASKASILVKQSLLLPQRQQKLTIPSYTCIKHIVVYSRLIVYHQSRVQLQLLFFLFLIVTHNYAQYSNWWL